MIRLSGVDVNTSKVLLSKLDKNKDKKKRLGKLILSRFS
nr:MAG TPA: hypothetical protein [Caudoviricetes sp.]